MLGLSVSSPFFHLAGHTSPLCVGAGPHPEAAQQLLGVAADAVVLDLDQFDDSFGVHYERAAIGHALLLDHYAEAAGKHAGRIGEHRVLDLADALRGVVPGLVHEVRVGAHRVDFDAHGLELLVLLGHVYQLGGAYEGEVGGVEEEYGPLALDVFVGDGLEYAVVVGLDLELGDRGIDDRCHVFTVL